MCFSADVLDRLLSREADIIAGAYKYRHPGGEYVVCLTDKSNGKEATIPDKLFTAYAAGTGCMLIKMSVFDKVPRPWFSFGPPEMQIGEDMILTKDALIGYLNLLIKEILIKWLILMILLALAVTDLNI